jgi:hypothetical protein
MIARTPPRRRAHHPHGELRERLGNYMSVRPLHVGNYLSADTRRQTPVDGVSPGDPVLGGLNAYP